MLEITSFEHEISHHFIFVLNVSISEKIQRYFFFFLELAYNSECGKFLPKNDIHVAKRVLDGRE